MSADENRSPLRADRPDQEPDSFEAVKRFSRLIIAAYERPFQTGCPRRK